MKKWQILADLTAPKGRDRVGELVKQLLRNRGLKTKKQIHEFLNPVSAAKLTDRDAGISRGSLAKAAVRIRRAIRRGETIVVYADYDADGVTAGAIAWEALNKLGAKVMPYIPHRVEEGYGLSVKGIDAVRDQYHPGLIITVDHGITARDKVAYAQKLGIDVIVTDHHVKPKKLPACTVVHTTGLSGAGVAWFLVKELLKGTGLATAGYLDELTALAAIGTIADIMPLIGANRSLAKWGLAALNQTKRVGLTALIEDAGLTKGELGTYDVSHILAPRLNAMGRLVHAMDALRLLCTPRPDKAMLLARQLGLTNQQRQKLTEETSLQAKAIVAAAGKNRELKKLLFVVHEQFNQGVIGLVAGRLVEEYYRPAVVVSRGETVSKASARSISGFNIVEAIRGCGDILVDVGGHPMAAGFTVETKNLALLQQRLENLAERQLTEATLTRSMKIDARIPLERVTEPLWQQLCNFAPFGFGNPEPVFASLGVAVVEARPVGADGQHLKLVVQQSTSRGVPVSFGAIAFGAGGQYRSLRPDQPIDIAYTIDRDSWNGNRRLQLKIKDIRISS